MKRYLLIALITIISGIAVPTPAGIAWMEIDSGNGGAVASDPPTRMRRCAWTDVAATHRGASCSLR